MIVQFKVPMLAAAGLLFVLGVVLSTVGECRRSPAFLRSSGLTLAGVGLGTLVALALAS